MKSTLATVLSMLFICIISIMLLIWVTIYFYDFGLEVHKAFKIMSTDFRINFNETIWGSSRLVTYSTFTRCYRFDDGDCIHEKCLQTHHPFVRQVLQSIWKVQTRLHRSGIYNIIISAQAEIAQYYVELNAFLFLSHLIVLNRNIYVKKKKYLTFIVT